MDVQRTLLIGVIAVLSFMLLTEWVSFKEQQVKAPAAQIAAQTQTPGPGPSEEFIPSAGDAPVAVPDSDEVPVIQAPSVSPVASASASSAGTIRVTTDVLDMDIDLEGGDITRSALTQFPANLSDPDIPILLLQQDQQRVYVAQSGLIGANGIDKDGRATFTSSQKEWTLAEGEDTLEVRLDYQSADGVTVTKVFTFERGSYVLDVKYLVENRTDARWEGNLFGQIKRDGSADPSSENQNGMGMVPFLGTALTQPDERFSKFDFDDMAEKPFKGKLPGGWIAMIQHYFLTAWIPNPDQSHNYSTRKTNAGFYIGGFVSPTLVVDPGKSGVTGARFYAGPKDQYALEKISEYLDLSVDYGWLWWIAQPLFWLLTNIHDLVGNWGVAIILLTVLIKAAFFQLSATSYRSMANMRRVQPQMVSIRERHADDKQKQSQAMMDLYKKEKINPLGGCLPILVQMPVFIALYWVLMESVELRQAPFYGWITDLSVMDPYFVLPLIMGASMWFQQKLNPPPPDPMQAKVMQWMPIIFTFFFLWFPAGLVLYWVANNLLSITQQWVITKQIENASAKT